jgi:O-antigen ligase
MLMNAPMRRVTVPPLVWTAHHIPRIPPSVHLLLAATVATSTIVMFEPAPCDALFVLLVLAVTFHSVLYRSFCPNLSFFLGMFLLAMGTALSLPASADETRALFYMTVTFYLFCSWYVYASILAVHGPMALDVVVRWFVIAAVVTATVGILARFHLIPYSELFMRDSSGFRIKSTFKDPNVLGPVLVCAFMLYLERFLRLAVWTCPRFIGFSAIAILLLAALLFAFSRGAFLHFFVSLSVFLALHLLVVQHRITVRRLWLSIGSVTCIALIALPVMLFALDLDKVFRDRLQYQEYDNERFAAQQLAWEVFQSHPLGIGPGQWTNETYQLDTHNVFLRVLAENGILGVIGFSGFVVTCAVSAARGIARSGRFAGVHVAVFASLIGAVANSLVIDSLHWRHLYIVFAISPGLLAWDQSIERKSRALASSAEVPVNRKATGQRWLSLASTPGMLDFSGTFDA